jgi:hypothetical protein
MKVDRASKNNRVNNQSGMKKVDRARLENPLMYRTVHYWYLSSTPLKYYLA